MRNYNSKYVVRLTEQEREELQGIVSRGKVAAGKRRRAQVLLKADAGREGSGATDAIVAEALNLSSITVHRARKAYVEEGLAAAIDGKPNAGHRPRKVDGAKEAVLVATACSSPPAGKARWTLRMLAGKLVELKVVDTIGKDCVADALKKNGSSPVSVGELTSSWGGDGWIF